jgi:hypothetical protein
MRSQEQSEQAGNLVAVQELYAAFRKGDVSGILALLSPEVEWSEPENPFNPAAGTRRGRAGFLEWLRIGQETEQILTLEPRQFLSNDDSVAVVGYSKCLAKPTGRMFETDFVHLITFRDGKIARFQEFFDTYAAGEAFRSRAGFLDSSPNTFLRNTTDAHSAAPDRAPITPHSPTSAPVR